MNIRDKGKSQIARELIVMTCRGQMPEEPTNNRREEESAKESPNEKSWKDELRVEPPLSVLREAHLTLKDGRKLFSRLNMPALQWVQWTTGLLTSDGLCPDFVSALVTTIHGQIGWSRWRDGKYCLDPYLIDFHLIPEGEPGSVTGFRVIHFATSSPRTWRELLSDVLRTKRHIRVLEIEARHLGESDVLVTIVVHRRGFADLAMDLRESISELSKEETVIHLPPPDSDDDTLAESIFLLRKLAKSKKDDVDRTFSWRQRRRIKSVSKRLKEIHEHGQFRRRRPVRGTIKWNYSCLLYTSPSPRDVEESRMPSSA